MGKRGRTPQLAGRTVYLAVCLARFATTARCAEVECIPGAHPSFSVIVFCTFHPINSRALSHSGQNTWVIFTLHPSPSSHLPLKGLPYIYARSLGSQLRPFNTQGMCLVFCLWSLDSLVLCLVGAIARYMHMLYRHKWITICLSVLAPLMRYREVSIPPHFSRHTGLELSHPPVTQRLHNPTTSLPQDELPGSSGQSKSSLESLGSRIPSSLLLSTWAPSSIPFPELAPPSLSFEILVSAAACDAVPS